MRAVGVLLQKWIRHMRRESFFANPIVPIKCRAAPGKSYGLRPRVPFCQASQ